MSGRASWSRPSSVETAIASPRPQPSTPQPMTSRSAWWSVIRFGACVLLLSFALSLLALPWTGLPWWKVFRRCVSIAAALSLWLCIKKFERRSWRAYGLPRGREGARHLRFGLGLGFATLGLLFGLELSIGVCQFDVIADRVRLWRILLTFIPAAALVSFLEELVFRGFILQHLLAYSKPIAVIVSSALYALVHVREPDFLSAATGLELIGLFLLGGVLALSYLHTGQLFVAIGLHAAFAYGARVNKLLIAFPDPALSWLVGTSRLVNGLAGWAALLAVGGVVIWWGRRSRQGGGVRHGEI